MYQVHIFISGTVQGVGFRFFVKASARDLGLTGWVCNTSNGMVEAVFQGKKKDIEQMISLCHKGSFLSEVRGVDVEWEEVQEKFLDFSVK